MNSLLSWFAFLVNMTVVAAFVVATAMSAKRVGGAGPWLLAGVGVIDGLLIFMFRMYRLLVPIKWPDPTLEMLSLFDAVSMYGCGILALVALYLLHPKPRV